MAVSGVNFCAVVPKNAQVKHDGNKGMSVKTVAAATSVPVLVGLGYATRFYYENKGKASVYKEISEKFPKDDAYKSCLKLTEKSMRNAKVGAVALVVAGATTVLGYAGAKVLGVLDKIKTVRAQKQAVKAAAQEQAKTEKTAEKEKAEPVKSEEKQK